MELNREQIIKALSMCWDTTCTDCEFNDNCEGHWQVLENALALIKELTEDRTYHLSQIDAKDVIINDLNEKHNRLLEENEDWKAIAEQYQKQFEDAKADTVRKMQERLKAQKFTHKNLGELVYVEDIDQIAKEMLEGV